MLKCLKYSWDPETKKKHTHNRKLQVASPLPSRWIARPPVRTTKGASGIQFCDPEVNSHTSTLQGLGLNILKRDFGKNCWSIVAFPSHLLPLGEAELRLTWSLWRKGFERSAGKRCPLELRGLKRVFDPCWRRWKAESCGWSQWWMNH